MKILFVNPVGAIGGAERSLLTMISAFQNVKEDFEFYLILGTDGPMVREATELGVKVQVLRLPEELTQLGDSALRENRKVAVLLALFFRGAKALPALTGYIAKFQKAISEIKPDLIHTNGIKAHLLMALLPFIATPVVWHIQDFYGSRPLVARLLRLASGSPKLGIAISEAVAVDTRATLPHLPVKVIYHAVDINYFSPEGPQLELEDKPSTSNLKTQLSNRPLRVGLAATFARWKGHDIFLEAAARVIRDRPDINLHFYIIGGPIYKTQGSQFSEEELREKAAVLEIEDKIDFLGFQSDMAKVYRWLDIAIHASTQPEPFGLAIVEAMACSKPVIVSEAGGAAELFTNNFDALGVPPGDAAALSSAIQHLAENPDLRQTLSQNARQTAINRFSHTRFSREIGEIYRELLVDNC